MTTANTTKPTTTSGSIIEVLTGELLPAPLTSLAQADLDTRARQSERAAHARVTDILAKVKTPLDFAAAMVDLRAFGDALADTIGERILLAFRVAGTLPAVLTAWKTAKDSGQRVKWDEVLKVGAQGWTLLKDTEVANARALGTDEDKAVKNLKFRLQDVIEDEARLTFKMPRRLVLCPTVEAKRANGYTAEADEQEQDEKETALISAVTKTEKAATSAEDKLDKLEAKLEAKKANGEELSGAELGKVRDLKAELKKANEAAKAAKAAAKAAGVIAGSAADADAAGTRGADNDKLTPETLAIIAAPAYVANSGALGAAMSKAREALKVSGLTAAEKVAVATALYCEARGFTRQLAEAASKAAK